MKRAPRLAGETLCAQKSIGLDDEEAATLYPVEALKSSRLRDAPETKNSMEAGPFVFFVFAANETPKIQTPRRNGRSAEIQGAEGNVDGCCPAICGDFGGGHPKAIPAWIDDGIIRRGSEFFNDSSVALRAEGIDLKNISITVAESGIDGDGEVVVEVLGKIAAKLPGDDGARRGVVTMDADVEMA